MSVDAVSHNFHEVGGAALAVKIFGLAMGPTDVVEDCVLGPVPLADVRQRAVDQVGYLLLQSTARTLRRVASSLRRSVSAYCTVR